MPDQNEKEEKRGRGIWQEMERGRNCRMRGEKGDRRAVVGWEPAGERLVQVDGLVEEAESACMAHEPMRITT